MAALVKQSRKRIKNADGATPAKADKTSKSRQTKNLKPFIKT
jgi:hypothetical protein